MRATIAFLAGTAVGAVSALAFTDRALRELIREGDLTVTMPDAEGEALDRGHRPDVDGKGGVVIHINDPIVDPPGFHPSMLAEAWDAGRRGRPL